MGVKVDALSSVFVFGAGASFGSGPCHPHPPPLGGQLFAELQRQGGIAASAGKEIAELFAEDFEKGMDRFWAERNVHTTQFLREMAAYFAQFEPLPGNAYARLLAILGGTRRKAVLATTNYEMLLEIAVSNAGHLVTYGTWPVPPNNIPILKLHGSCNFLPDINHVQIRGVSFDLSASPDGAIMECGVRPARSPLEVIRFCAEEDSLAPAIAMYSPTKRVLFARSFVEAQQASWQKALSNTARVFLIGLRVHTVDEHIWGPLAESSAPIFYVGKEPDAFLNWANRNRLGRSYVLAETFEDALKPIAHNLRARWS